MTAAELTDLIRKTASVDDLVVLRVADGVYTDRIALVVQESPDGRPILAIEPDLTQE